MSFPKGLLLLALACTPAAWAQAGNPCAPEVPRALVLSGGGAKGAFLNDWMGVNLVDENVLPLIDVQTSPLVLIESSNPVIQTDTEWRAVASALSTTSGYYGGGSIVTGTKRYDGVTVRAGAQRLAQFTDPVGFPGAYLFSAATLNVRDDFNARIISFPYDFQSI